MLQAVTRFFHRKILRRQAREHLGGIELRAGEIAIDCGANIGEVTAQLSRHGATVYAFEPNPHAFAELSKRFRGVTNVHCLQKGVLDRDDHARLYLHTEAAKDQVYWSVGSSMLAEKGNVDAGNFVDVEVVDLARFITELARPIAVLKLDVEGVECRILRRIIEAGQHERIGRILVETHDEKMPGLKGETDEIRAMIASRGITNIDLDWV